MSDIFQHELTKNLVIKTDRDLCATHVPERMPSIDFSLRNIKLQPVDIRVEIEDGDAVDPLTFRGYTGMNDEDMDIDELDAYEQDEDMALKEPMTVRGFLASLEEFLDNLPDAKRGSVFLSQAGDGVCVNILIGMAFAGTDSVIRQVNIVIAPMDRELLNSRGTTINDQREALIDGDVLVDPTSLYDEMGKEELRQACRDAGVPYGKLNNDGMRTALKAHEAFDKARQVLNGGF